MKKSAVANLQKWNLAFVLLCLLQGVVLLLLSAKKTFSIYTSYLTNDPISSTLEGHNVSTTATQYVFDVNIAYLIAIIFLVAVIIYGLTLTVCRQRYELDLQKKVITNKFRWLEYTVGSALTMVSIALLSGIADLTTLIVLMIFSVVAGLLGYLAETLNADKATVNWLPYIAYCVAGLAQWLVLAIYLISAHIYGNGIPGFVYWLYVTMFLFFSGFAINMFLRHKKVGNWKDYFYGERVYLLLSLGVKTFLAWQVFGGLLHP